MISGYIASFKIGVSKVQDLWNFELSPVSKDSTNWDIFWAPVTYVLIEK